jgi:hypothetical protein
MARKATKRQSAKTGAKKAVKRSPKEKAVKKAARKAAAKAKRTSAKRKSAKRGARTVAGTYEAAISTLTHYIEKGGKNLSQAGRSTLEAARGVIHEVATKVSKATF